MSNFDTIIGVPVEGRVTVAIAESKELPEEDDVMIEDPETAGDDLPEAAIRDEPINETEAGRLTATEVDPKLEVKPIVAEASVEDTATFGDTLD